MSREKEIRDSVRKHYAGLSEGESACCSPTHSCCGTPVQQQDISTDALRLGYSLDEVSSAPEGANMGWGCGNPLAIASLKPGEVVVDLGSGAGFDCFLAADKVGADGKVIGVDMTDELIEKARQNAEKGEYDNVEFRKGKIEELPIEDETADVIISNCVINLSPEKERVYKEAYRVLKPGGRLAISDVIATCEMPEEVRNNMALHSCCISGAATIEETTAMLERAGFANIRIDPKEESRKFIKDWVPGTGIEKLVVAASVEAIRPG